MRKHTFKSIAAAAMAAAMAFSTMLGAVPAMAEEPAAPPSGHLDITIYNGDHMPALTAERFHVYQIFTGGAAKDEAATVSDALKGDQNLWKKDDTYSHWYDMSLSDIQWGGSFSDNGVAVLEQLKGLNTVNQPWLGQTNPFTDCNTARDVARKLKDQKNDFMQGFSKWLITNKDTINFKELSEGVTKTLVKGTEDPGDDAVKISVPAEGYYLIGDQYSSESKGGAVSEYILAVLGSQDIYLKADAPTLTKGISKAGSDDMDAQNQGAGGKGAIAEAGEVITFKLVGTLPKNFDNYETYKYIFHDTLSKGLTFGTAGVGHSANVKVIAKQDETYYLVNPSEYTVNPSSPNWETLPTEGGTMISIDFGDLKKGKDAKNGLDYTKSGESENDTGMKKPAGTLTVTSGTSFTVYYDATLNEQAVAGYGEAGTAGLTNANKADLEYSNDPNNSGKGNGSTDHTPDGKDGKVNIYTFGLDLQKVGDDPAHENGLEGAGFIITSGKFKEGLETDGTIGETMSRSSVFVAKLSGTNASETRGIIGFIDVADEGADFKTKYNAYVNALTAYRKAEGEQETQAKSALDGAIKALEPYMIVSKAGEGKFPQVTGGLDANTDGETYYLTEIVTPDGYDTMAPVKVTIKGDIDEATGKLKDVKYAFTDANAKEDEALQNGTDKPVGEGDNIYKKGLITHKLVNMKAPILPHTGGVGALAVYGVSAAVLACGAALLILGKKKRKPESEA